jgi:hypothetical protein
MVDRIVEPVLWRYSLHHNHWLNHRRPLSIFPWVGKRRDSDVVYDFTIWKGTRAVAAWSGTESEAFGAMLHLAAREEREAGMLDVLRGRRAPPEVLRETGMEGCRHGDGERKSPGTASTVERLKAALIR